MYFIRNKQDKLRYRNALVTVGTDIFLSMTYNPNYHDNITNVAQKIICVRSMTFLNTMTPNVHFFPISNLVMAT